MVTLPSLRPPSLFMRSQRNSRSSSINVDSRTDQSGQGRPYNVDTDHAALNVSLSDGTQAGDGFGPLVRVPLTPPPAFNASFAQVQKARLAVAARSPLGIREAPNSFNEGEKDRLQGLLRVESVRLRRSKCPNDRDRHQGASAVTRFKVWARHDGGSREHRVSRTVL